VIFEESSNEREWSVVLYFGLRFGERKDDADSTILLSRPAILASMATEEEVNGKIGWVTQ